MAVLKKKRSFPARGKLRSAFHSSTSLRQARRSVKKYPFSFASLRWHYPNQVRSREYTLLSALFPRTPLRVYFNAAGKPCQDGFSLAYSKEEGKTPPHAVGREAVFHSGLVSPTEPSPFNSW